MSSSTSSSDAPGRLAHDRAGVPSGAAEARVRDGGASDGGGTAGAPTWSRTRDRAEGAPVTVAAGRPWWHHVRVPAFVLAALLLVEVGVRAVEERLSIDVRHINRMDEIVTALVAAPGPSVLFVGNSLTREGVDLELMRAGLAANGAGEWNVAAVYPDDTAVLDWLYLYDRYVVENDAVPDAVVVGFGIWHLEDRPISRAQAYRLGRHFASDRMLGQLLGTDLTTLTDRMNVLLARYSAAFANRERVSRRVLALLPGYEESAQRVNDLLREPEEAQASAPTYGRLERFVREVVGSGAELVLAAMPTRAGYDLDPELVRVAEAAGARVLDLRDVPGLTAAMFADPLHLDDGGAELFSRHAAQELAPLLSPAAAVR